MAPFHFAAFVSFVCVMGLVAMVGAVPVVGSGGGTELMTAAVARDAAAESSSDGCARRLFTNPEDFAPCKLGTYCFLFLHEEPFTRDNPLAVGADQLDPRVPFPCKDHGLYGQDGLAWSIYDELLPNSSDLCAFAGGSSKCTFNDLIQLIGDTRDRADHPGFGMGLALHGTWVISEERAYLATASDSYMEVLWHIVGDCRACR